MNSSSTGGQENHLYSGPRSQSLSTTSQQQQQNTIVATTTVNGGASASNGPSQIQTSLRSNHSLARGGGENMSQVDSLDTHNLISTAPSSLLSGSVTLSSSFSAPFDNFFVPPQNTNSGNVVGNAVAAPAPPPMSVVSHWSALNDLETDFSQGVQSYPTTVFGGADGQSISSRYPPQQRSNSRKRPNPNQQQGKSKKKLSPKSSQIMHQNKADHSSRNPLSALKKKVSSKRRRKPTPASISVSVSADEGTAPSTTISSPNGPLTPRRRLVSGTKRKQHNRRKNKHSSTRRHRDKTKMQSKTRSKSASNRKSQDEHSLPESTFSDASQTQHKSDKPVEKRRKFSLRLCLPSFSIKEFIFSHYHIHVLSTRQRPAVYYIQIRILFECILFLYTFFLAMLPFFLWLRWYESLFQGSFFYGLFSYFDEKFSDLVPLYIFLSFTMIPYFVLYLVIRIVAVVFWKSAILMDYIVVGFSMTGSVWYILWSVILWIFQLSMYIFGSDYDFSLDANQNSATMWIPPQQLIIMCALLALLLGIQGSMAQLLTFLDFKIRRIYWHYRLHYPGKKKSRRTLKELRSPLCWKLLVCCCPSLLIFGPPPDAPLQRLLSFVSDKSKTISFGSRKISALFKQRKSAPVQVEEMQPNPYKVITMKGERISAPQELIDPDHPILDENESLDYKTEEYTWTEVTDPEDPLVVDGSLAAERQKIRQLKRRREYEYNSSDYTWSETEFEDENGNKRNIAVRRRKDFEDTDMTFIEDEEGDVRRMKKIPRVIRKRNHLKRWSGDESDMAPRMKRKKKQKSLDSEYDSDDYTWTFTEDDDKLGGDIRKLRRRDNLSTDYTITEDSDDEAVKLPARVNRARHRRRKRMRDALDYTQDEYTWTETLDEATGRMIRKRCRRDGHSEDYTIVEDANGFRIKVPRHMKEQFGVFDLDALMRMVRRKVRHLGQKGDQMVEEEELSSDESTFMMDESYTRDDSQSSRSSNGKTLPDSNSAGSLREESTITGSSSVSSEEHHQSSPEVIDLASIEMQDSMNLGLRFTAIEHFEGGEKADSEDEEEANEAAELIEEDDDSDAIREMSGESDDNSISSDSFEESVDEDASWMV